MKITLTIILILFLIQILPSNTRLVNLTTQNFKQNFGCELQDYLSCKNSPKRDWFIMFMAPWCGHCKTAKPGFQNFAAVYTENIIKQHRGVLSQQQIWEKIEANLQIGLVDCQKNRPLCYYFYVKGFPTFIYVTSDKKGIQYTGPRKVQSFLNFTVYHDPDQQHINCKHVKIAHTQWEDTLQQIIASVKHYWLELIVFSLIIPSIIGYFLGQWYYGKRNKAAQKKPVGQAQSKDLKNQ